MEALTGYVCSEANAPDDAQLIVSVRDFGYKLHTRWSKCNRTARTFENKHKEWLQNTTMFSSPNTGEDSQKSKTGPSPKPFSETTPRTQRRRVRPLRSMASAQELGFAAEMNLREEKKEDAAKIIHEAVLTSPTRPSKMRKFLKTRQSRARSHTTEEALSLYIDTNSSQGRYQLLRNYAIRCNAPEFYPTYKEVKLEMDKCIPISVLVADDLAEVPLQALLDHTAERLIFHQREVIEGYLNSVGVQVGEVELILEGKYGFDGSSSHANYKQNFEDTSKDDSSIFMSSYAPLKMSPQNNSDCILWYNVKPSSARYCRPIRMRFAKETTPVTIAEKKQLDDEISSLQPTTCQVGEVCVKVTHSLACSIIDGKIASCLTGFSVQRCPVCGAYQREFHNLKILSKKRVSKSVFDFGVSPLHFGIRAMECLLHIAYRVDFKRWKAMTPRNKILMRFSQTYHSRRF